MYSSSALFTSISLSVCRCFLLFVLFFMCELQLGEAPAAVSEEYCHLMGPSGVVFIPVTNLAAIFTFHLTVVTFGLVSVLRQC